MWASLVAQLVKNLPAVQGTSVQFWVRKICWRRERLPTPVFLGFPCGSAGKESACNVGDLGWEDPLQKGKATHSSILALENSMDGGTWLGYSPWGCKESDTTERLHSIVKNKKVHLKRVIVIHILPTRGPHKSALHFLMLNLFTYLVLVLFSPSRNPGCHRNL